MAKGEPRNHHHIPQGYLRGFAVGSGKKARVTVAAMQVQNWFETNPRNIGAERDFLRIEIEGHAPGSLETAMAEFEGKAATAIRNVGESLKFEGDDRIVILNLMALLAVRSPQMRESMRQFQERLMRMMMDMALATKERWEGQLRQMKAAGKAVKEEITYEQMKDFHERGEYDITVNREFHIGLEFTGFEAVLQTMVDRIWRLFVADEKDGPFVTSDRPVVIIWTKPEEIPVMMRGSPGYGMKDTEVYFPLTHKMAVVGVFEGPDETTMNVDSRVVAMCNTRMIEHALAQVYTIRKVFPYIGPPYNFYQDAKFMERFAVARAAMEKSKGDAEDDED